MRRVLLPWLLGLTSALIISACSPIVISTPPPSPEPIQVFYTPTLRPWLEVLHQCALEHPEIALITEETSAAALDFTAGDLTLWFGEPPQGIPGYAASLGMDEIVMIAGLEVARQEISTAQLRDLYSTSTSPYQVWTYNEGNDLRSIFDDAVLGEATISSYTSLTPDPAAMIEAIAADPMAIGYIPKSWLMGDVQTISIESDLQNTFRHPILALTNTEPEGNTKNYLVCLQQNGNP